MDDRRTPLIPIPQIVTGNTYVQNIIQSIVYPFSNEIRENLIFMDDNTWPHNIRRVQDALKKEISGIKLTSKLA